MYEYNIFESYRLGNMELKNRIVMAPMTRCRAINNIPNELMATYYGQRANAGLIITEGVSPSPNGLGYARIPGVFNNEQVEGWKKVSAAVHNADGKIFMQLMHTGRVSHKNNMPVGSEVMAPSAIKAAGEMYTDSEGMQEQPVPKAMTHDDVQSTIAEYTIAAKHAINAGFDGIELHGANGYLLEQFISPHSNARVDKYGGSIENRCRFVIEVAMQTAEAIGSHKVGIRLSPYGVFNNMPHYNEIHDTYVYLAEKLDEVGIAYIHLIDHSTMGAPVVPDAIKAAIREKFGNTLILSGGYDKKRAEEDIALNKADLIAFAKPFINNPDLVKRMEFDLPLNEDLNSNAFYTPDEVGYTDYPTFENSEIST